MRLPKVSLRKCFLLTIGFAVLVIFGISIREKDIWKSKDAAVPPIAQHQLAENRHTVSTHHSQHSSNNNNHHLIAGNEADKSAQIASHQQPQPQPHPQPAPQPLLVNAIDSTETQNAAVAIETAADTLVPFKPVAVHGDDQSSRQYLRQSADADEAANADDANNTGNGNDANAEDGDHDLADQLHSRKPWFFTGGKWIPKEARRSKRSGRRLAKLMPEEDRWSDRITNQLMFVPPNYEEIRASGQLKTILLYNGLGPWGKVNEGRDVFIASKCPVNTCRLTADRDRIRKADMVLYKDHFIPTGVERLPKQVYMLYFLESPYHTQHVKIPSVFNWTSTYRMDSDIVAPYEKWEYYDQRVKQIDQERNYALNKTKKVAWFVSNCGARNGRLQYANELAKHIQVDIYGSCGSYKCSRSTAGKCFDILDHDYKFYLAFENSNCRNYITEKLFVNALNRNILPIVMGARPEDYAQAAPYRSYIHVDEFASAKELAEYLHVLDGNDELYNSYFRWKGTGELINTYFWCRVCAMLHDRESVERGKWYEDVNEWWRGTGVCSNGSWRNRLARKEPMSDD